jgi:hypothetical protein
MRSIGSRAWIGELVVRRAFQRKTRNDTALILDAPCGVAFVRKPCVDRTASRPSCVPTKNANHTALIVDAPYKVAFVRKLCVDMTPSHPSCIPTENAKPHCVDSRRAARSSVRTQAVHYRGFAIPVGVRSSGQRRVAGGETGVSAGI